MPLFLISCGSGLSNEQIHKAVQAVIGGWKHTIRYVSIGLRQTSENSGNMDYSNVDESLNHELTLKVNGDSFKVVGTCRYDKYYDEESGYELNGSVKYELWFNRQRQGYGSMTCAMDLAGGPVDTLAFHLMQNKDGDFEKVDLSANGRRVWVWDEETFMELFQSLVTE